MNDGDPFALAGLWDHWDGEGENLESCSIIVMPANDVMKTLHERMPAIIAHGDYDLWMNQKVTDKAEIMGCLDSAPSARLVTYPISSWVTSPKHDDERCLEPTEPAH